MDCFSIKRAAFTVSFLFIYSFFSLTLAGSIPQIALSIPISTPLKEVKSYLLMDADSGRFIITSNNKEERLAPASLTKLMTLYLVANQLRMGQLQLAGLVSVSKKAGTTDGSRMFIEPSSEVSVGDLIQGIVVQSGNDASIALAEHLSGSEEVFARLMNQQAQHLGMQGTHFANASGMSETNHYTTLIDMALLVRAIVTDFPEYYHWYSQKSFVYNNIKQMNRNRLLWLDASVDGIKTGRTQEAGYCLAASAMRDGMRLIALVMGAPSDKIRTQAAQVLLNNGFQLFETHKLYSKGEVVANPIVWCSKSLKGSVGLANDLYVTIPRGCSRSINQRIHLKKPLVAPLAEKDVVGEMQVFFEDDCLAVAPLVIMKPVEAFWLKKKVDGFMAYDVTGIK